MTDATDRHASPARSGFELVHTYTASDGQWKIRSCRIQHAFAWPVLGTVLGAAAQAVESGAVDFAPLLLAGVFPLLPFWGAEDRRPE